MKTRTSVLCITSLLLATLLVLSSPSVAWGRVKPLGFWIHVDHWALIWEYSVHVHHHYAPYAYRAYAILVESSMPVDLWYDWEYPYLHVYIWNPWPGPVYVEWQCWFWVW